MSSMIRERDLTASPEALRDDALRGESVSDKDPVVFTRIFEEDVRLTQWDRQPGEHALNYVHWLIDRGRLLPLRLVAAPESLEEQLKDDLPDHPDREHFISDVTFLAEMFACLFGMEEVGIRLSLLKEAMCPRFHVDKIGARMVCTYAGAGTQWLSASSVSRSDSGIRVLPPAEGHSDLSTDQNEMANHVPAGTVALMKGDMWPGAEGNGLVHRSPQCSPQNPRLFLSMDVM